MSKLSVFLSGALVIVLVLNSLDFLLKGWELFPGHPVMNWINFSVNLILVVAITANVWRT